MIEEWTFSPERAEHFRKWLNLSSSDLRWTDEHKKNVDRFWELFFSPPMQLKEIHQKFYRLEQSIKTGTLRQWVRWLRDRFNCYLFIFEKINLRDLALDSFYRINDLAFILREFFVSEYPGERKSIDKNLNVGNYLSENLYVSFEKLRKETGISEHEKCLNRNNLMTTLEIPFFEEFSTVIETLEMQDENWSSQGILKDILVFNLKTLKFALLFGGIGALLVFGIKSLRGWNDWYLAEKIKISIPSFYNEEILEQGVRLPVNVEASIGLAGELKAQDSPGNTELDDSRESTESDLVIASLKDIPLPMKAAAFENSDYEEKKKGGFRDYKYGRSRAYRLMINSLHPKELIQDIGDKLKTVAYKKADNVEPGKEIPGGHYYNLYVNNDDIPDFIKYFDKEDVNLFVSRTPVPNPKGMSRLFIWIKRI